MTPEKLAALAAEAQAAYERDALADALASLCKPRFWCCSNCFGWHREHEYCGVADALRYTSGELNHRYGFDGWERLTEDCG